MIISFLVLYWFIGTCHALSLSRSAPRELIDLKTSKLPVIISNNNAIIKQKSSKTPPILFIHGSFHSAWCWEENFIDYFSNEGYNSYSISLRGTSSSIYPKRSDNKVSIEDHIEDLTTLLTIIRQQNLDKPKPIIISHSFGGIIAQKLLEDSSIRDMVSGVALLCSVPPSGNGPMTARFIKKRFWASLKIVYGFVFKGATKSVDNCRELFFDSTVPTEDIERWGHSLHILIIHLHAY